MSTTVPQPMMDLSEKMVAELEELDGRAASRGSSSDLIERDEWYQQEQSQNLEKSPIKSVRFNQSCVVLQSYHGVRVPGTTQPTAADRPQSSTTTTTSHTCRGFKDTNGSSGDRTQPATTNCDQPAAPFNLIDKDEEDDW
jgi:hypothetical protein